MSSLSHSSLQLANLRRQVDELYLELKAHKQSALAEHDWPNYEQKINALSLKIQDVIKPITLSKFNQSELQAVYMIDRRYQEMILLLRSASAEIRQELHKFNNSQQIKHTYSQL